MQRTTAPRRTVESPHAQRGAREDALLGAAVRVVHVQAQLVGWHGGERCSHQLPHLLGLCDTLHDVHDDDIEQMRQLCDWCQS